MIHWSTRKTKDCCSHLQVTEILWCKRLFKMCMFDKISAHWVEDCGLFQQPAAWRIVGSNHRPDDKPRVSQWGLLNTTPGRQPGWPGQRGWNFVIFFQLQVSTGEMNRDRLTVKWQKNHSVTAHLITKLQEYKSEVEYKNNDFGFNKDVQIYWLTN